MIPEFAMKLSVPFIPDNDYVDFLTGQKEILSSIYFPLPLSSLHQSFDARVKISAHHPGTGLSNLSRALGPVREVKKYVLMNTRFLPPAVYTDTKELTRYLDRVLQLHQAVGIQGIVVSDLYLLNALDRTGHEIIPLLEAVPGVNAMMDSIEKIQTWLELLEQTRFALPGRLILDRSLNRDPEKLTPLYRQIKSMMPGLCIELLGNEGCIFHCPFKPAHDAHIALSNTGLVKESTWKMNQTLGCHAYFNTHPHKFFKSPFIRPEDADRYKGMADTIKICGRTLGPNFLKQCIKAYATRSFRGNLLELMDAAAFLAQRFHIHNPALEPDFFKRLTTCTKNCKTCRICDTLFKKAVEEKSVGLTHFKDIQ